MRGMDIRRVARRRHMKGRRRDIYGAGEGGQPRLGYLSPHRRDDGDEQIDMGFAPPLSAMNRAATPIPSDPGLRGENKKSTFQ